MNTHAIQPGSKAPDLVNVLIEIPAQSVPVKYEVDKETGALMVDRFLATAMFYPCNYGYIPNTLSDDGDPIDVLVVTPYPLIHGAVIEARPVGVLKMTDESGVDEKILAVPASHVTPEYDAVQSPEDVSKTLKDSLEHFFKRYKDLEPNKWVEIDGWAGADVAKTAIRESIERYNAQNT